MSGILRKTFMSQGTIIYRTPLTLYLDLWTIIPKCHFSKWNKIYLNYAFYLVKHYSVHTLWHIWIQDPRHNLYHWALPHIEDIDNGYLISISTRHNLSTSLYFSSFFRYLNLFRGFMKCYVNMLFYSTCLIIMIILIIWSFFLQEI